MITKIMQENYCNELHIQTDVKSGCVFIIALNTTYGSKSNGGTRMAKYPSTTAGIKDAARLVQVMTKKCIIIGKKYNGRYSGGKGVIIGDPKTQKSPDLMRRYGVFVNSLNGKFQTGTDINIDIQDAAYMAEKSKFVDGLASGLGDTAIPTAFGVMTAMKKICELYYGSNSLKLRTAAVQGYGNVGRELVKLLLREGAFVVVSDVDKSKLLGLKNTRNVRVVAASKICRVKCDIFSPNATGEILNNKRIQELNCNFVIGAANNPLANGLDSVQEMEKKEIIYVPDYVINIGGVFLSMCEAQNKTFRYCVKKTKEIIENKLEELYKSAHLNNCSLYESSEKIILREMNLT